VQATPRAVNADASPARFPSAEEREGLVVVRDGLFVTAQGHLGGGEVGQRGRLDDAVGGLPGQGQRLVVLMGCLLAPPDLKFDLAEVGERVGLAGAVAGPPVQGERLLVVLGGRSVAAQQPEDGGQVAQGAGPADLVSGPPE